jgi:hypothetical protein
VGGVFWLSFADPKAVPAEIAACGGANTLHLRPNFADLPLDEQVQLVQAAWQDPLPRLLIFDNCEDPDLLIRWRPTSGGCRVMVTSRRADWASTLGVQHLPLGVLQRWESIALLREHQPNAEDEILDAIAAELGDLPLALHLAGSYLARYRRSITPAQYLAQLQDPALLQHHSLKSQDVFSPTDHLQNVYRTISLSYDQLKPDDPIDKCALQHLAHAACLAPGEPIPYDLLTLSLDLPKDDLPAVLRVEDALHRLVELGLIRSETDDAVRLHRLIVAFVKEVVGDKLLSVQEFVEMTLYKEAKRINQAGYPGPLLVWQPHLRTVTEVALKRADERTAGLSSELG